MVSRARLFGNDSTGSHRSESFGGGEHSLLQRSVRLPLVFDAGELGWTFYGSVGVLALMFSVMTGFSLKPKQV